MKQTEERRDSELFVFAKVKDLVSYILLISGKSPVKYRYSILNPLISTCLSIIELLYEANDMEFGLDRLSLIRRAKTKLKTVDFLSSIAANADCFTEKQHETILNRIGLASKYLMGFYNHSKKALGIS